MYENDREANTAEPQEPRHSTPVMNHCECKNKMFSSESDYPGGRFKPRISEGNAQPIPVLTVGPPTGGRLLVVQRLNWIEP